MLITPTIYFVAVGSAEGKSELNAFDNALLKAGIGNLNLVRVTSVIPIGAKRVDRSEIEIPRGALVPAAFGSICGHRPGETIAAAVGVGVNDDGAGVIMEYSGRCTRRQAEARVARFVEEAFAARRERLAEVVIAGTQHRVRKMGCAVAAVVLWYL
ncbi:MAG: arginine decarboxylase, pyruvoyl-dependent [Deltaproteobacteria bacterium]|nr:arginine decarboxylase, pyruvoyl-dependent [Deltaproteobacteria bacterium]